MPSEASMIPMTPAEIKRLLEATLLASAEALPTVRLRQMFGEAYGTELLRRCLEELQADWRGRAVQLVQVADGWRFQTVAEMQPWLERLNPVAAPRYSRAVLETLTIIAYRQPVTRGDVEEIRGVAVSTPVTRTLEERGWIEVIGHRDVPGRPALYATTRRFLSDFGLRSLAELPPLPEIGTTPVTLPLLEVENEESDAIQ